MDPSSVHNIKTLIASPHVSETSRQDLPLPDEIVCEILSHLSQKELEHVDQASFKLRNISFEVQTKKLKHLISRLLSTETVNTFNKQTVDIIYDRPVTEYTFPFSYLEKRLKISGSIPDFEHLKATSNILKVSLNFITKVFCCDVEKINKIAEKLSLDSTFVQKKILERRILVVQKCIPTCPIYEPMFQSMFELFNRLPQEIIVQVNDGQQEVEVEVEVESEVPQELVQEHPHARIPLRQRVEIDQDESQESDDEMEVFD